MKVGDLVSYQDLDEKWVGVVKKILPGFIQYDVEYAVVVWIDPRNGKLNQTTVRTDDFRIKIESKADVQPR